MGISYDRVKRWFDITAGCALLVVSLPAQVLVALQVRRKLGSPVLFKQERPGMHGRLFTMYKFRTMLSPDPARGLLSNEDRMTSFGQRLRATSLDELPSLWNVVRGDMSLVGPRPLRAKYLPRYTARQATRHDVRPGVTGLAQVSGRNSTPWEERFEIDARYVESHSLALDLRILWQTVSKVLKRDGIVEDGQATMSEFQPQGEIRVRQLTEDDLDTRVRWLSDDRVRDGITIGFWPDRSAMSEWLSKAQRDECRYDLAVVDGDEVVAMVGLVGVADGDAELYIYVDPEKHGQRYGHRAMLALIVYADSVGVTRLSLETKPSNTIAKTMYDKLGFTVDESLPDKIFMSRSVRHAPA